MGSGLTATTAFGLFIAICVAQTNSLFAADAWNNITFTSGAPVYLFWRAKAHKRAVVAQE